MSTSSEDRSCAVCGQPTKNPKFCSRSCSAKATNRERPKRKPEGSCEKCGASISTRLRLCPTCEQIVAQETEEKKQNILPFRTLAGQIEKERIDRAYMHQEMVFDCGSLSEQTLNPTHPVGDLIKRLLSVLDAKPAYVRQEDIPRFACLLRELREYETQVYEKGKMITDRVKNMPIRCLNYALQSWIDHFFEEPFHPLLPTFAVGLTQFIEPHIYDLTQSNWGEIPWRINPLVHDLAQRHCGFELLRNTTFKREFTQRIRGLEVIAKIPHGGCLYDQHERRVVVQEQEEFPFVVLRGHLTEQRYYDRDDLVAKEADEPSIDIAYDFHFQGHLLIREGSQLSMSMAQAGFLGRSLAVEIPIRWITQAKVWNDSNREAKLLPVPQWQV